MNVALDKALRALLTDPAIGEAISPAAARFCAAAIDCDLRVPAPIANIIGEVAYQMGLRRDEIIGRCRDQRLVRARAAVVWLAHELTGSSLNKIGRVLGGRDHSTIFTARRKGDALRQRDPAFRRLTDRIRDQFRNLEND